VGVIVATTWEQARTSAKCHEHSIEWICAL
jgi:hypothetical protein